jgi:hypothetical protein
MWARTAEWGFLPSLKMPHHPRHATFGALKSPLCTLLDILKFSSTSPIACSLCCPRSFSAMSSPPPPSGGPQVIPIPPGMTVQQFETLQNRLGPSELRKPESILTDKPSFQSPSVRHLRFYYFLITLMFFNERSHNRCSRICRPAVGFVGQLL